MRIGMAIGAAINTAITAISGGNLGMGALTGAISGGFFAGAGVIGAGLDSVVQAGIHFAAGAISGAINAGITGGNVWQSAITSGLSAGVAKFAMLGLTPMIPGYAQAGEWGQWGMEGAVAVGTGTVMGGFSSTMMGRSFGAGAELGAWTSAFGFMFNRTLTKLMPVGNTLRLVTMEVSDDGGATVTGEKGGLSGSPDPLTDFATKYGIPYYFMALSLTMGGVVAEATGSATLGGLTYWGLDAVTSGGSDVDIPLPKNLSAPGFINPTPAY